MRKRAAADPVTRYAEDVVGGRVPTGTLHRLACARHLADLGRAAAAGWTWDREAARRAIAWFDVLPHFKGEWAGRRLTLEPWQAFIVGSVCGWKRRSDGMRRFRVAFVEVPRGNGKSTLVAGLALYLGFVEGEPGAETYTVATKRDQARIVFDAAREMVKRTPALARRVHVGAHHLEEPATVSRFLPLGADADTLDGLRPHLVVADEVHAHPTARVIDVMETGMGTRRQPVLFEITTAGVGRQGPWWRHREYARLILEGRHDDPAWFCLIAGADPEDDWTLPATWRKANPNYAISVKPEDLEAKARRAAVDVAYQSEFRRLHVGQLVEQEHKVIDRAAWDAGARAYRWADLRGRRCYGGLDLAVTNDLSAAVFVFEDPDGGFALWPEIWIPEADVRERSRRDRVPYDVWAEQGWVRVTPGNITDYDVIRRDLNQLAADVELVELGIDPWNAWQLAGQLRGDWGEAAVPEVRQGYRSMSEPTKRFTALIREGKIRHPGSPVLTWAADNFTISMDPAGNQRPDKSRAMERIDPIVAAIIGLARVIDRTTPRQPDYQIYIYGGGGRR